MQVDCGRHRSSGGENSCYARRSPEKPGYLWFPSIYGPKAVLMNTARWMQGQGEAADQGTGRLDLEKAAAARAVLVTVGETRAASHSFGLLEHKGEKTTVSQELQVADLGQAGGSICRLRLSWIRRAPGMFARMSSRQLVVAQGSSASFQLSLNINGGKVPDGTYTGLIEAHMGRNRLRLPFAITVKGAIPSVPPPPGPSAPPSSEESPCTDARCRR